MTWAIFLPVAGLAVLSQGPAKGPANTVPEAPLVVIDPGHGGRNAGAQGQDGVYEKEITLAVSARLAGHLEARGIRCIMTRDHDSYLTLRERTRIANEHHADLFLSIHANSSGTGGSRGYEAHVLSVRGTQIDTPALRRNEGTPRLGVDADVASVLDSVEHGVAQERAAGLAADIVRALAEVRGSNRSRGVRQDSHHVLLGATMPAVLVEVGFVDHPIEGRELTHTDVQDDIARVIADAAERALR